MTLVNLWLTRIDQYANENKQYLMTDESLDRGKPAKKITLS